MSEPIFNEDGWPVYREHSKYSGIFFLLEEDCPPNDYTDDDYYAYHDADGNLLNKDEN